ncbi:Triosephosphate isomerase [Polystyrenella longa]|uniref:Triosephosphate isomerase n=1 Tax=Polystyrenella longa TaxID=2528007 RepID=A0A518CKU1_9PLAN|nr:triose-phosphate isomerase [Polystyrenella longa]QDU79837.1 Triosephosphate isomerase [Polystyrenella longa]
MRKLVAAGNWKMNTTLDSAGALASDLAKKVQQESSVEVILCPPFPYLTTVKEKVSGSSIKIGGQNCYHETEGAFTGETSVGMLQDIGCDWVILGHSERRHVMGETDADINKKTVAALEKGLGVILCVGELLEERQANKTNEVLQTQMEGGLSGVSAEALKNVIIAYEPVWAIGTGVTASTEEAESAHDFLRKWLTSNYNADVAESTRILYGGSVKPDNAEELMSQPNVDGALVGGASLKADSFGGIIDAAVKLSQG